MALVPANHQFGPVEISGSPSLHQGARYVKNMYFIREAFFSSLEGPQCLNDGILASRKQYRDHQDDLQDQCGCRSKRARVGEQKVEEQGDRLLDGRGQPTHSSSTALDSATLRIRHQTGVFLILLEKLQQALYSPLITRHKFAPMILDCTRSIPYTAGQEQQTGAPVTVTQKDMSKQRMKMVALCVLLICSDSRLRLTARLRHSR